MEWVKVEPSEIEVGDTIKAVWHSKPDDYILGTVAAVTGSGLTFREGCAEFGYTSYNGKSYSRPLNRVTRVDHEFRVYYRQQEEQTHEVEFNGHIYEIGEGDHVRAWVEGGRLHVEQVFGNE